MFGESGLDAPPELVGREALTADAGHLKAIGELAFANQLGQRP